MNSIVPASQNLLLDVDRQIALWRADTKGTAQCVHLNNAGSSLMPAPVADAIVQHIRLEEMLGGYEAADLMQSAIQDSRGNVAELLNTHPRNVAILESATTGFERALASFDFSPGDVIVTTRNDYISNQLAFMALAQRLGVVIRHAADLPEGGVDPQSVRTLLRDPRCKLMTATWIPMNSGLVQPVHSLGEECEAAGIPFVVDACQAVGQIPIDLRTLKCDYLSASARKFLRGPRGIGFLYVSDRQLEAGRYPLFIDMRGARWTGKDSFQIETSAIRFEQWEFAYALVLGLGAAAAYAQTANIATVQELSWGLASYAREQLARLPNVRVLDRGRELCAIVTIAMHGWAAPDVVAELRKRQIHTSRLVQELAVFDMKDKGVASALRISPHYFNTRGEIDLLREALREILASARL